MASNHRCRLSAEDDDVRQPWLPKNPRDSLHHYKFNSCAIVGNGGTLLKTNFGPNIDSHKVVMRSNQVCEMPNPLSCPMPEPNT